MNEQLFEHRLTLQERHIEDLQAHVRALEDAIRQREDERSREEKQRLMAGVLFLGSVIITLSGTIWAYRSVIIGGKG